MPKVEVTIIGHDRVKAVLARTKAGLAPEVAERLDEVAERVKEDAKAICPVDTGSLRRSIRKAVTAKPAKNVLEVGVRAGGYIVNPKTGRRVDYAAHVEYGTLRTPPKAFLRPAVIRNRQAVDEAIRRAVRDTVKKVTAE